jgi:hypothetical protein
VHSKKISEGESKKFIQYFKRFSEPTESESNQRYDDKWLKDIAESSLSKQYFLEHLYVLQKNGEISRDQCIMLQL